MPKKTYKVLSLLLCFLLIFEQSGFAQMAGSTALTTSGQLDISGYLAGLRNALTQDKFRPLHLRYLAYDTLNNNFKLLLDKGDLKDIKTPQVQDTTQKLLEYFFIGVSLPNDSFWVNLRPDSPDNIIDPYLAQTDVGKILLEADLQLKKDTAKYTSPENPKGKEYWEKLYKKAGELFGYDNITIPTLTRPWIIPDEIIVREANENAYIYKATLKVQLEQDHLKDSAVYNFDDPRLKELNEYSSQLIRELIIPELTKEINISKRYAPLRQVYYSLILAQWFKQKFSSKGGFYSSLIDRRNLNGITSKDDWSKTTYFKEYQKSFQKGEYNIQQPIYTPFGQAIRSYFSGGIDFGVAQGQRGVLATAMQKGLVQATTPGDVLAGNSHTLPVDVNKGGTSDNVGVDRAAIQVGKIEESSSPLVDTVPKGTPATLLRYMHDNRIFIDNPKKSSEMAIQRGGNDSLRTIQRELRVLRETGLIEGSGQTGYYLPEWLSNMAPEEIIGENPELNKPSPSTEEILTAHERILTRMTATLVGVKHNVAASRSGSSPVGAPRRLTIAECRQQLVGHLMTVKSLYPTLQREFAYGLEVFTSEGIDAFERKAYPRILEATDAVKVRVDAVSSLPAVFGFTEPELQSKLDAYLRQIAEELRVDKVLIWFGSGWTHDFTYTLGFTEEELIKFHLNRNEILGVITESEVLKTDKDKDKDRYNKAVALMRDCGMVSGLEISPDYEVYSHVDDSYIRIVIGRSQRFVDLHGELTEENRGALTGQVNALIVNKTAPWLGVRGILDANQYRDFSDFMMVLRHNGGIDVFKVGYFPFIYSHIPYFLQKIRANDSESQKWRDSFVRNLQYFVDESHTIDSMETFLQVLEKGTDFKPRNITRYVHDRV